MPLTPQQRVHHDENGAVVTRIVSRWRKTGYLSDVDQRRLQMCAAEHAHGLQQHLSCWTMRPTTAHKADELLTLLDEWLEDPAIKVVVFSQWLGTHEIIRRRLVGPAAGATCCSTAACRASSAARWSSVSTNDADCRIFLSTDAGGVGLNLQHAAAVVVNMDLPWNPAVLEQRIGRVHRMGQARGVQVVNLIGQGSIEEGMLGVLAFKKSLFAGVLDGGASEVFLHGTRLASFMKSVEQVAGAMGVDEGAEESAQGGDISTPAGARGAPDQGSDAQSDPSVAPKPTRTTLSEAAPVESRGTAAANDTDDGTAPEASLGADPWADLLQAGAAMMQGLAAQRRTSAAPLIRIERDPESGQSSLRIPMPDPAILQQLAKALAPWLKR